MRIRIREPFRSLPGDIKVAVVVIFLWMLLLSGGVTLALIKQGNLAAQHYREQRASARQTYDQCIRAKVFGPPFLRHIELVEGRLHLGALEHPVEWPPGSGKKVGVLEFYRSTIPKACPAP